MTHVTATPPATPSEIAVENLIKALQKSLSSGLSVGALMKKRRLLTNADAVYWFAKEFGANHPLLIEYFHSDRGSSRDRLFAEVWLRLNLFLALQEFKRGGELDDGGRRGAYQALVSVIGFLDKKLASEAHLVKPLRYLLQALLDLEHCGIARPILLRDPLISRSNMAQ